ncbi:MAG TPA: cytochrome b, partial [Halomonas sp.]|nr:cytochrome b [Halomonas sp.]
ALALMVLAGGHAVIALVHHYRYRHATLRRMMNPRYSKTGH